MPDIIQQIPTALADLTDGDTVLINPGENQTLHLGSISLDQINEIAASTARIPDIDVMDGAISNVSGISGSAGTLSLYGEIDAPETTLANFHESQIICGQLSTSEIQLEGTLSLNNNNLLSGGVIQTIELNAATIQGEGGSPISLYMGGGGISNAGSVYTDILSSDSGTISVNESSIVFASNPEYPSGIVMDGGAISGVKQINMNGEGDITGAYQIYLEQTLNINMAGGQIRMKSPDGTEYEITVANGGTLTVAAV